MTDATASLTPALAGALGITVVPVPLQVGAEQFVDGVDAPERFYELLAGAGRTAAEIVRWLESAVPATYVYAAIWELTILRRSGRVGLGKAFVAGLLNIKPVLQVKEGAIDVVDQVRSFPPAVQRLVELARGAVAGPALASHAGPGALGVCLLVEP